jgi:hypothetical protein
MLTPNKTPVKQRKIPDYIGIENLEKARVQMYRVFERLIIRKAFTYGQSYLNYALFRDYWNKTFGKNYGHLAPLQ